MAVVLISRAATPIVPDARPMLAHDSAWASLVMHIWPVDPLGDIWLAMAMRHTRCIVVQGICNNAQGDNSGNHTCRIIIGLSRCRRRNKAGGPKRKRQQACAQRCQSTS